MFLLTFPFPKLRYIKIEAWELLIHSDLKASPNAYKPEIDNSPTPIFNRRVLLLLPLI